MSLYFEVWRGAAGIDLSVAPRHASALLLDSSLALEARHAPRRNLKSPFTHGVAA